MEFGCKWPGSIFYTPGDVWGLHLLPQAELQPQAWAWGGSPAVHSHIRAIMEKLSSPPLHMWCLTGDELVSYSACWSQMNQASKVLVSSWLWFSSCCPSPTGTKTDHLAVMLPCA